MNIVIKSDYFEKNHSIVETWKVRSIKALKKTLCDVFDLPKDSDGFPIEPNFKDVENVLTNYADEEFIKHEYERQKNNWNAYCKIIKQFCEQHFNVSVDLDKNWTVTVLQNM